MREWAIKLPDGFSIDHPVSHIDENHLLYGNFIGVQYVFDTQLDAEDLTQSIAKLAEHFPALAGVYNAQAKSIIGANSGLILKTKTISGSYRPHSEIGTVQSNRHDFVDEPSRRDVLAGRAPLSTFTLSNFEDGGSILGVAISHVLTDAAGLHILMRRLGKVYSDIKTDDRTDDKPVVSKLEAFAFGTNRTKTETSAALLQAGLKRPVKTRGLVGGLLKKIIIRAMDNMAKNNRIVVHFSAEQVQNLKQKVLEESGEDWISTNVALCAHFTGIMATLMYEGKKKTKVQIGQLLDLRGRYFEQDRDLQDEFVGNAILIHTAKATFPGSIQYMPRGQLARWFKQNLATIDAAYLQSRLDLITDCLRQGYSYVGLELTDPMIALNNQSKMPVYNVNFAGTTPVRVIPQDVGDNIMFFPTRDGGIEIYIRDILNPKRQDKLLTEEWRGRIFDF